VVALAATVAGIAVWRAYAGRVPATSPGIAGPPPIGHGADADPASSMEMGNRRLVMADRSSLPAGTAGLSLMDAEAWRMFRVGDPYSEGSAVDEVEPAFVVDGLSGERALEVSEPTGTRWMQSGVNADLPELPFHLSYRFRMVETYPGFSPAERMQIKLVMWSASLTLREFAVDAGQRTRSLMRLNALIVDQRWHRARISFREDPDADRLDVAESVDGRELMSYRTNRWREECHLYPMTVQAMRVHLDQIEIARDPPRR
jgi:hypothetical protein